MNKRDALMDMGYEHSICIIGYDDAIIGVSDDGSIIYDYDKMIVRLVEEGMTREEAIKRIDYNIFRLIPYAPDPKPIVMYAIDPMTVSEAKKWHEEKANEVDEG